MFKKNGRIQKLIFFYDMIEDSSGDNSFGKNRSTFGSWLTWLHTACPNLIKVAKCSLLKLSRSYLNSCCSKVSQRYFIHSGCEGARLCLLLLTLIRVPAGSLSSVIRWMQTLVCFRTRSPLDFGTICCRRLRQAFWVMFSSGDGKLPRQTTVRKM